MKTDCKMSAKLLFELFVFSLYLLIFSEIIPNDIKRYICHP